MTTDEARAALGAALKEIAPEIDLKTVDAGEDLRRALDIDSFDFLKMLVALAERSGVEIPESDYAKVGTLNALVSYLVAHARR